MLSKVKHLGLCLLVLDTLIVEVLRFAQNDSDR